MICWDLVQNVLQRRAKRQTRADDHMRCRASFLSAATTSLGRCASCELTIGNRRITTHHRLVESSVVSSKWVHFNVKFVSAKHVWVNEPNEDSFGVNVLCVILHSTYALMNKFSSGTRSVETLPLRTSSSGVSSPFRGFFFGWMQRNTDAVPW